MSNEDKPLVSQAYLMALSARGIKPSHWAEKTGTSTQNLSKKLKIGKFPAEELRALSEELDVEITFSAGKISVRQL